MSPHEVCDNALRDPGTITDALWDPDPHPQLQRGSWEVVAPVRDGAHGEKAESLGIFSWVRRGGEGQTLQNPAGA